MIKVEKRCWKKPLYLLENIKFVNKTGLNVCVMRVGIFAEQFLCCGLTCLSSMKKKAELSWKSYLGDRLESKSLYKLVVVTFDGFVLYWIWSKTWIWQSKKSLFLFKVIPKTKRFVVFSFLKLTRVPSGESAARRELDNWSLKETKTLQNHQMIGIATISFLVSR